MIGVLDSGIQDNPNLGRAVDRDHSYNPFGDDYVDADANTPLRHGTSVAQVIAGRRDGAGPHGLAYEATLLDLALANEDTDIIDPNQPQPSRRFAPAIQTGLGGGARLFNASFSFGPGTTDLSQTVDDFRTRFQQIGIYEGMKSLADAEGVLVVSTGNDSTNNPNLLATAGLMGEFSGHVIAVTSIDANDTISDFATRCSVLQEFCLAAVGENVPETLTNGDPSRFFGTSASAPVVTGAIALLKQEFPELSYPDTARIVLDTARDLGAPGTDAVYGRGALDLGNAFTPQGEIRIAAAYDVTGPSYAASESTVGAQDSMVSTLHAVLDDVRFMVYDGYTRGFDADLGSFVSGTLSDSPPRSRRGHRWRQRFGRTQLWRGRHDGQPEMAHQQRHAGLRACRSLRRRNPLHQHPQRLQPPCRF